MARIAKLSPKPEGPKPIAEPEARRLRIMMRTRIRSVNHPGTPQPVVVPQPVVAAWLCNRRSSFPMFLPFLWTTIVDNKLIVRTCTQCHPWPRGAQAYYWPRLSIRHQAVQHWPCLLVLFWSCCLRNLHENSWPTLPLLLWHHHQTEQLLVTCCTSGHHHKKKKLRADSSYCDRLSPQQQVVQHYSCLLLPDVGKGNARDGELSWKILCLSQSMASSGKKSWQARAGHS